MPGNVALLRSKIESACAGRVSAPFNYRDRKNVETASAGISEIDSLAGGLPRGSLTEISGPAGAGRMSLLTSVLASRTAHAEACALIDGRDSFDPHSAEAAGVELARLLWVRCRNIDQALRATDLLIQGGGFGFIALDLCDIAPEIVRHVPLNAWFRFRRAVEDTPTIFLVLDQEPNTRSCASLALRLDTERARWSTACTDLAAADLKSHTPGCLLDGFQLRAEVLRSRIRDTFGESLRESFAPANAAGRAEDFETQAIWSHLRQPIEASAK
jgi:recombination protein RecA